MWLEVKGRTLKLVSDDYIAAAEGDLVRALYEPTYNGPLLVKDCPNRTRGIRFRNVARPLAGVAADILGTVILLFTGVGVVLGFGARVRSAFPHLDRLPATCGSNDPGDSNDAQGHWTSARPCGVGPARLIGGATRHPDRLRGLTRIREDASSPVIASAHTKLDSVRHAKGPIH